MAKRTPVASNPRTVQEIRTRYYEALKQGLGKTDAAALAHSKAPLPEAVGPSPVEPVPAAGEPEFWVEPEVKLPDEVVETRKGVKVIPVVEPEVIQATIEPPVVAKYDPEVGLVADGPELTHADIETPVVEPSPAVVPSPDPDYVPQPQTLSEATTATTETDLRKLRGVGTGTIRKLNQVGIHSLAEVASWTQEQIEAVDAQLNLHGRIIREDWVGQAKALMRGD